MQTYRMNRITDINGISGTGIVAEVVEFTDGTCVVRWIRGATKQNVASTVLYDSKEELLRVHGHDGMTVLEESNG